MRTRTPVFSIGFIILFVIIAVVAVVFHAKGPCGAYKYSAAKDIPARCLSHFNNK